MLKRTHKHITLLVCIAALCVTVLTSCSISIKKRNNTAASTPAIETHGVTGVVLKNDTAKEEIQLRELETDTVDTLSYGETSVVTDRYQQEKDASEIEIGEIFTVEYRISDAKIVTASVPEDEWEYQDVKKFSFDADQNMMKFAGEKYQYDQHTYFASETAQIDTMEFSSQDVLTVRGIGIKVYSAVRTSGFDAAPLPRLGRSVSRRNVRRQAPETAGVRHVPTKIVIFSNRTIYFGRKSILRPDFRTRMPCASRRRSGQIPSLKPWALRRMSLPSGVTM